MKVFKQLLLDRKQRIEDQQLEDAINFFRHKTLLKTLFLMKEKLSMIQCLKVVISCFD